MLTEVGVRWVSINLCANVRSFIDVKIPETGYFQNSKNSRLDLVTFFDPGSILT